MEVKNAASSYVQSYETSRASTKNQEIREESDAKEVKNTQTDAYVKSEPTNKKATYEKTNKLTSDQIQALKDEQAASKAEMLKKMMEANLKNQANVYGMSKESQDLIIKIFGSIEAGIPPLATNPEEAQKAIEEGGAYSVDAVADRIMKMAEALSGGNKENIGKLRDAVKKGFKAAGLDFKDLTGSKLPKICEDTYDEIMKRFDAWEKGNAETSTKESAKE